MFYNLFIHESDTSKADDSNFYSNSWRNIESSSSLIFPRIKYVCAFANVINIPLLSPYNKAEKWPATDHSNKI